MKLFFSSQVFGEDMQVKLYSPPHSKMDPSIAVMLVIAVLTVVLGGFWSGECERWAQSCGDVWNNKMPILNLRDTSCRTTNTHANTGQDLSFCMKITGFGSNIVCVCACVSVTGSDSASPSAAMVGTAKQTVERSSSTPLSKSLSLLHSCVACSFLCTFSTTSSVSGVHHTACERSWNPKFWRVCFIPSKQFTSLLPYSAWHRPQPCSAVLMRCWKNLVAEQSGVYSSFMMCI